MSSGRPHDMFRSALQPLTCLLGLKEASGNCWEGRVEEAVSSRITSLNGHDFGHNFILLHMS